MQFDVLNQPYIKACDKYNTNATANIVAITPLRLYHFNGGNGGGLTAVGEISAFFISSEANNFFLVSIRIKFV
jgi:hypothetical protein